MKMTMLAMAVAVALMAHAGDVNKMSAEEIVALPRANEAFAVPKEGLYLSSGVNSCRGQLAWGGGYTHTEWSPAIPKPEDVPHLMARDNQGNVIQWWAHNDTLTGHVARTYKAGMCAMANCSSATPEQIKWMRKAGKWVCYDLHEMFSFGLYDGEMNMYKNTPEEILKKYTLTKSAEDLLRKVRGRIDQKHADGWGILTSSSASSHLDYLMLGGLDAPGIEFYPFGDTSFGMSLCRGMARQFGSPAWHAYLAHDWYSYFPHTNPHKMDSLMMMLRQQYMAGVKILTLESGNQWSQSNLCVDSPQSFLPPIKAKALGAWVSAEDARKAVTDDELLEAHRKFSWIDYRSPVVTKYRKIMSEFWDFCKANPAPKGQPEAVIALAKGHLDISSSCHTAVPVAGAYNIAKLDHHWMNGAPELSWNIVKDIFYPKPPNMLPNSNLFYSGSPYGQVDVVSFAFDRVSADYLVRNYKAILFSGWNTCTPKQYKTLCEYVKRGGRLCLAIPHLSTNDRRNYDFFTKDELVNGGDFSELCGLKMKGEGERFYWATGTDRNKNVLGLVARRRYGIIGVPLGNVEFTGPKENYDVLAVDDEAAHPVIIRCKSGKGEVFFMNIWHYPWEANRDNGTGAVENSKGLIGELYSYIARITRGNVWITGSDFERPDEDCNWINYSYFPEGGKICLMNLDYDRERKCVMHWFGEKEFITLRPGEFRVMNAPVLDKDEMLNSNDGFDVAEAWHHLDQEWWRTRWEKNLAQIKGSKGEIDLVFLGDSITHYWDVGEGSDKSTEIEELKKKYSILSAGYGGDWCQNVLWRVSHGELDGYKAKLVMLTIGTNNAKDTAEQVVARTREIVKVIREKQPDAKLLLLPVFPRGQGKAGKIARMEQLLFASDFDDHVIRFSFNDKMLDKDGKLRQELFEDGLHPSAAGYTLWRREVEPIFRKVVGR